MIRRVKTGLSAETKAENSVQVRQTVEAILGDIAARTAMGSNVMYCASKAALDNMTQSSARALAPARVTRSPGQVGAARGSCRHGSRRGRPLN